MSEHQFKPGEYGLLPVQIFAVGATRILLSLDIETEALSAVDGLPIESPDLVVKHGVLLPYPATREGGYRLTVEELCDLTYHAAVAEDPWERRKLVKQWLERKEAGNE